MKVTIEIQGDENPDNATFSVTITDMDFKNRKALSELPDMVKEAYVKFHKLATNTDMHPVLHDYIS